MGASLPRFDPQRIVVMGVAGCGKSTVGAALGTRLGLPFIDGDALHPPQNIAKMTRGEPLTDEDRQPWLRAVGAALRDAPAIVGCSALKRAYRDLIRAEAGAPVVFVHLAGTQEVIAARMRARKNHFMPPALLASQFATLEPPGPDEAAITVDLDRPVEDVVAEVLSALLH